MGAAMSTISSFVLGTITFEVAMCTDPSTGAESISLYRTEPRELVATGEPDALRLRPGYESLEEKLPVLEQAVMDSLEGAAA
jgi:hypothetical protein